MNPSVPTKLRWSRSVSYTHLQQAFRDGDADGGGAFAGQHFLGGDDVQNEASVLENVAFADGEGVLHARVMQLSLIHILEQYGTITI